MDKLRNEALVKKQGSINTQKPRNDGYNGINKGNEENEIHFKK